MITRIILIYSLISVIVALFFIKFNVQKLNKKLVSIEAEMIKEQDNIHILRAELAHLSKPQLITKLASQYLNLQPIKREQLISIELPANSISKNTNKVQ